MSDKVIICAAMSGAGTFKNMAPSVPYTPEEFAEEASKAYKAGAAMVHVHARSDDGMPTHDVERIKATHDAIKEKTPELIVNLSTAVGMGKTPEQRIQQIVDIKPEMASLNTNSMNFAWIDKETVDIKIDFIFENTFTMLKNFAMIMKDSGTKPECECYDIGGLDNVLLMSKLGIFTNPVNFNFVWGVTGGQQFRPDAFAAMVHALPPNSNFTTCGVADQSFQAAMQSCIMGGHIRVGLEDSPTRMPNGDVPKGNYELVEVAVKIAECAGREIATPDEAREIMGINKK